MAIEINSEKSINASQFRAKEKIFSFDEPHSIIISGLENQTIIIRKINNALIIDSDDATRIIRSGTPQPRRVTAAVAPGCAGLPYAAPGGHVMRRRPPPRMPTTPTSHPLMTYCDNVQRGAAQYDLEVVSGIYLSSRHMCTMTHVVS